MSRQTHAINARLSAVMAMDARVPFMIFVPQIGA